MGCLWPTADGGPPPVDPGLVIPGARKAFAKHKPAVDVAVVFFNLFTANKDGTMVESLFAVDGAGRIFWECQGRRVQIAEMAVC